MAGETIMTTPEPERVDLPASDLPPSDLPPSDPTTSDPTSRNEFEQLHFLGHSLLEQGRLREGADVFARALDWAEQEGDRRRIDLAFCNLCAFEISLAGSEALAPQAMNRLRQILMRNEDPANCFLAAYNLARVYELKKEARKGLFYARIAFDRSTLLGRREWIGSSHNQIGNFLVAQSLFEEASGEYRKALGFHPHDAHERRAISEVNLAYCHLVQGRTGEAFRLLYRSLRSLRRLGSVRGQMFAHIDLCYAHMDAGRLRDSVRHGERGLALAESLGEADWIKNALYLLGQARHLQGDDAAARSQFHRLETEFFPGSSGITDFLLAVDVRGMINLRA